MYLHGAGTVIPHLNFSISCAVLAPLFKFEEGLATSILVGSFCWILSKLVKKVFTCHCFLSKKTRYERHGDPSNTRPTKWRLTNSHRYGPWCHHCHQHNTLIYNVSFLTFCSPLLIRLACKLLDDLGLHQKTLSQKWYIPVIAGNTKH